MRETSTGETAAFASNVVLDGAVENWLVELEHAMKKSMQQLLAVSIQAHRGKDKEKWITDVQGQLLITTGSIQWTNDCSKALGSISNGKKRTETTQEKAGSLFDPTYRHDSRQLPRLVRTKLVALITMEIHNRDVMERMIKAGCSSVTDFDWLCQLRFLFNKEEGQFGGICTVRQTNCNLDGYEYQGQWSSGCHSAHRPMCPDPTHSQISESRRQPSRSRGHREDGDRKGSTRTSPCIVL